MLPLAQTHKAEEGVHCPQGPRRILLPTPAAFGEPFSHDLPKGCCCRVPAQSQISFRQILIPPEADVGSDRKSPKLPQNVAVPFVPRAKGPAPSPGELPGPAPSGLPFFGWGWKQTMSWVGSRKCSREFPCSEPGEPADAMDVVFNSFRSQRCQSRSSAQSRADFPSRWMCSCCLTQAGLRMCSPPAPPEIIPAPLPTPRL